MGVNLDKYQHNHFPALRGKPSPQHTHQRDKAIYIKWNGFPVLGYMGINLKKYPKALS